MTHHLPQPPPRNTPPSSPMFTFDVSAEVAKPQAGSAADFTQDIRDLLLQLVNGQQRQNHLLEELIQQTGAVHKQRAAELGQWRKAHPHLAQACREAVQALGQVQAEYLQSLTAEVNANAESMVDSEFLTNEFVDRYGPRLAHLNGVLQVLSQLGVTPAAENAAKQD